jgi:RNA polymerase sigma factor (sigma-70 family)
MEDWLMAQARGGAALRQLRTLYSFGAFGALSDEQLLSRFGIERGEAGELAFAVLVERHGPMVLGVCRAVLGDEHEAHDAFQATFLVLARRCCSLRVGDSLGPWLYEVARRVAASARAAAARRRRHECHAAEITPLLETVLWRDFDLERLLHDEIDRLPERYRVPVVLCLLEGLTHEQAARHLGWPIGTVKSRLAGGRERLRTRLLRRGVAPGAALSAVTLAASSSRGAMPAPLAEATARAAVRFAKGQAAAGAVPTIVASLAAGAQRSKTMIKALLVTAAVLAVGAIGLAPEGPEGRAVSGIRLTFVDLQWIGNHKLADPLGQLEGNNLAGVPQGPQKLGGTWFKIGERLVRVRGQESAEALRDVPGLVQLRLQKPVQGPRSPEPPEAVRGIAIGARFDTLHILHSTMFGNGFGVDDGTEIGSYIVHYADRTTDRIPIIYGQDVRDWWRSSDSAVPSRGKVGWSGKNAATDDTDEIRLFASEWDNPHPEKTVAAIDFETKNTICAPFLVALTLERTLHTREDHTRR